MAIDGLDAMTGRRIGSVGSDTPTLVLLTSADGFAMLTATRFKWEEV